MKIYCPIHIFISFLIFFNLRDPIEINSVDVFYQSLQYVFVFVYAYCRMAYWHICLRMFVCSRLYVITFFNMFSADNIAIFSYPTITFLLNRQWRYLAMLLLQ